MTLRLTDFDVAYKVSRGGYLDDVLGTKVNDVTFMSISKCVGACNLWSMLASDLAQLRPGYKHKCVMHYDGQLNHRPLTLPRNVAYGHASLDVSPWGFEKRFLLLYCIEMKAIVEEKVSGGMDEEGREVQTLTRRLIPLHCALHLWF